ncbi:MAG: glycosyltransferase family 1 protein [Candidatus Omnitrophota bacterium]|nr:glycosyltransferase family 1 protein [Candidatus Omnitrophota bacterium]
MSNIRIAYDYHLAQGIGGIGEYSRGLLNSLCGVKYQEFDFFLFYNSFRANFPTLPEPIKKRCRLITTRFPLPSIIPLSLSFKYKLLYPYLCRRHKINIFHGTEIVSLTRKNILSISTVADVFFKINPDFTNNSHNKYMRKIFSSLNRYNSIIAMSSSTKNDLIKFNVKAEKIAVIYNGLNDIFLGFTNVGQEEKEKNSAEIKKKYSLPEEYFLYVGNFVPRKNIPRLIDIFYKYRKLRKIDIKLLLIGPPYGEDYLKVRAQVDKLKIEKDILFMGCVTQEELPYIYSNAKIFFFLSLYEGFGIPPLEAMAVGTPAIVADNSSLTELTKGYSFLVNPEDDQQIFNAIDKILNDRAYVKDITLKASEYAHKFTWDRTARETLDLYKKVSGKIY